MCVAIFQEDESFRRNDGKFFTIREIFPDGYFGGDISEEPFGVPLKWKEVSPEEIMKMERVIRNAQKAL